MLVSRTLAVASLLATVAAACSSGGSSSSSSGSGAHASTSTSGSGGAGGMSGAGGTSTVTSSHSASTGTGASDGGVMDAHEELGTGGLPLNAYCGPSADGGMCGFGLACCLPCTDMSCSYECAVACSPKMQTCHNGCELKL